MTYQDVLNTRLKNELLLMDYFKKVNVPTDRLQKVEVLNGRNCKCSALRLVCNNEDEFNYHRTAFYGAYRNGGEFFQYDARRFELTSTINDGWN